MAKSTQDLIAELAGIGQDIEDAAKHDVREYLAKGIENEFLRADADRSTFEGQTPNERIEQALAEWPTMKAARLQAMLGRIKFDTGVTDDFRAGILFAVKLIADEEYDY